MNARAFGLGLGILILGSLKIAACKSNETKTTEKKAAIYSERERSGEEKPSPPPSPSPSPSTSPTTTTMTEFPPLVADYVGVERVDDAGAIHGRVVWQGPRPSLALEPVTKDQRVCGKEKDARRLVIDADGGVANTLVWLSDVKRGKKLDTAARASLGRKGCAFVPHLLVAPRGGTLDLSNDDPVLHNAHAYLGVRTLFNVGFTSPGQTWHKPLPSAGLVEVKNDAGHPFMTAYVMVAEHPYYAVSDARGAFALEGVPPGTYTLHYWHEGWRVVSVNPEGRPEYDAPRIRARKIVVERGGKASLDLVLD